MFRYYLNRLKIKTNPNDINTFMQRLNLKGEFNFGKLTLRTNSSTELVELENKSTTTYSEPTESVIATDFDHAKASHQLKLNKTGDFILRNFSSLTCVAFLIALILGFSLFLMASINLIISFSRSPQYYQFVNGSELLNLTKNKNQSILFRVPSLIKFSTIIFSQISSRYLQNKELCDLASKTLSIYCNYNVYTCHPKNLEKSVFETLNNIFNKSIQIITPFWSENLSKVQIMDIENFSFANNSTISSDVVIYLEYFSNQTISETQEIKLDHLNKTNSLKNDLEACLSYCTDLFTLLVLDIKSY